MIIIKKNIWSLFYLILFISSIFFTTVAYSQWKHINEDYKLRNENFTKIIATSTKSYFNQIDMIIELLGKQLLEEEKYKDNVKSKELFKKMLKINNSIIAYALIDINGNYLVTHLDEPPENIPSVLSRQEAKESFLATLKTDKTVIGRTYNLTKTKILAIPVRKTFLDENGNAHAVISIAIDTNNFNLFDRNLLDSNSKVIELFRDSDLYRQLYIHNSDEKNINDIYSKPFDKITYDSIIKQIEKTYNKSINEIKEKEITVSFESENIINNQKYLISKQYINEHQLWASSYVKYDDIIYTFLNIFALYITIYIVTIIVIWRLFKYIDDSEKIKHAELEYKATHDELTQLPNRYYLINKTDEWIKKYSNFNLIFIDIDNFKSINDSYGHKIGDLVLKEITNKISKSLKKEDLLIRQGGDEFIVFTTEIDDIESYSNNLLNNIKEIFNLNNKQLKITASFGVARYPNDSENIDDLITCSDMALYEAKKLKNTYVIFTEDVKNTLLENIYIEKELKTALENDEFYLVYQPQINYDNSINGVETLIRWNNKKLGFVPPDKFIPIVESSGMMPTLGDFIIKTALKEIKQLQTKISFNFQLSINISVKQFLEKDFYTTLIEKVEESGLKSNNITLEVTESIFIDNLDYMVKLLQKLRDLGFKISMDDFGTGYSSLSMLRKIPINELKIDKSFVDDITTDKSAEHMIKTIISIGKILNYEIVLAEGVEEREQVDLLHKFGCNTYQGYYYSKPLKLDELEKFILSRK